MSVLDKTMDPAVVAHAKGDRLTTDTGFESHITLRSIIVGCLLGILPTASNFYLSFKAGWGFGATFFAAIFGYPIMMFIAARTKGQPFNVKEHCSLTSVCSAVSGLSSAGFVNGLPAMFRLGLLDNSPDKLSGYMGKFLLWSTGLAFFGCFFAIPLRKWFIIRNKHLPFPSATGAANVLLQLHQDRDSSDRAKRQFRALAIAGIGSILFLIFAYFLPVIRDWRIFWWMAGSPDVENGPVPLHGAAAVFYNIDRFSIFWTFSFAFFGAGMMMGTSAATSFFLGTVIAWPILGRLLEVNMLVKSGLMPNEHGTGFIYDGRQANFSPKKEGAAFWILWPGVIIMLASSFTELGLALPSIIRGMIGMIGGMRGKKNKIIEENEDPVPPEHQVPFTWWGIGGIITSIYAVVIMWVTFKIPVGESILAIFLGFVFSFVALQAVASTDINPIGTTAKITQSVFSAFPNAIKSSRQTISIVSAMVTAGTASHACDLIGDLKTGHLVGASPRSQFISQLLGSIISAPVSVLLFWVYVKAYPCILDPEGDKICAQKGFGLQAVKAWKAFTEAITDKNVIEAIPPSSKIACIILLVIVILSTIVKEKFVARKYHDFFPQWQSIGVGFINSSAQYAVLSFTGAIAALIWKRRSPTSYELLMYSVASGFVAGEGLYGLFQAIVTICGVEEGLISKAGWHP